MPDPDNGIVFDPEISPEANVERFMDHLAVCDADLADLLKKNISILIEAGEGEESNARQQFNRLIAEALDAPETEEEEGTQ